MKRSRFTERQIIQAIKKVENGLGVPDLCRELGIGTATFYKCRAKYGGMDAFLVSRMKELEEENRRLRKMYMDENLEAEIAGEALAIEVVRRSRRREMAQRAVQERGIGIRLACQAFRVSERCYRDQPKRSGENDEIALWLERLTQAHWNWGFGLCF